MRSPLMGGHARRSRRRHPVARRVRRSVAVAVSSVPVGSVPVPMGSMLAVSMPGVSGVSGDVSAVGQGLHVDRGIAESDSWG
jgi:hypothetical protein